jgi:hypothetical protein
VRTIGYKVNLKLSLFYKNKNLITTCHFLKKEGYLDNGMKPFWWKYSVGLNQNLNPPFELNPSKMLKGYCGHFQNFLFLKNFQKLISVPLCLFWSREYIEIFSPKKTGFSPVKNTSQNSLTFFTFILCKFFKKK